MSDHKHNNEKEYFAHQTAIVDDGAVIGKGTKIWHFSHIMTKCIIGENCNIGQNVVISPDVIIGNNNKIQNNVSVYTGVICEDDVFMGPSMVFTNVINPRSAVNRKAEYMKTYVKQGATFGANCTIVCGISIGKYAFVGAGAVVTKDVRDYALIVGNPGRQIGWMSEFGQRLEFDEKGFAICSESKEKYEIIDNQVNKLLS
jgi:UDP-2-acetamido-3-amino-2,3-dideoxy-glucuronate N-acetyltransferase